MADDALFTVAGQEFKVTSSERVFYPATGTTKLDVIRYYADVSGVMLPGVTGRLGRAQKLGVPGRDHRS